MSDAYECTSIRREHSRRTDESGAAKMNVDNCKGCGRLKLKKPGHLFCADCMSAQSDDLRKIKEYILRHPLATVLDIHREAGVPIKAIHDFIRDDRVQYR